MVRRVGDGPTGAAAPGSKKVRVEIRDLIK